MYMADFKQREGETFEQYDKRLRAESNPLSPLYNPPTPKPLEPDRIGPIVGRIGVGPIESQTDFIREILIHLALNETPLSLHYLNKRFGVFAKKLYLPIQGMLDRAEAAGLIKMRFNSKRKKTYIYSADLHRELLEVMRETGNMYFLEETEADADMTPAQQRRQIEERRAARNPKPVPK
jgi:hypothetical protein